VIGGLSDREIGRFAFCALLSAYSLVPTWSQAGGFKVTPHPPSCVGHPLPSERAVGRTLTPHLPSCVGHPLPSERAVGGVTAPLAPRRAVATAAILNSSSKKSVA